MMTHVGAVRIQRDTPPVLRLMFRVINVERTTTTLEYVLRKLNTIQTTIVTRNSATVIIHFTQVQRTLQVRIKPENQTRRTRHVRNYQSDGKSSNEECLLNHLITQHTSQEPVQYKQTE